MTSRISEIQEQNEELEFRYLVIGEVNEKVSSLQIQNVTFFQDVNGT